jgi:hypothetical protein
MVYETLSRVLGEIENKSGNKSATVRFHPLLSCMGQELASTSDDGNCSTPCIQAMYAAAWIGARGEKMTPR